MEKIANKEELLDNVELFLEELENEDFENSAKAIQLIKSSNIFLAILTEEVNFFIPSFFLDYKNPSFNKNFSTEQEKLNAQHLSQILNSTPNKSSNLDELFLDFCDEVAINRNDVGTTREYWILKDL